MLDVDYRDRFTLGVEMAGELIGMGSYHYDSERASAEVAFTVADAHHAQGIGTLLLEHLVAAALSNGIQRFDAHTLGDNRQMLDVFRHAGFAVRRSLDAGVFDLEFDLSVPADGAVAERERIAETRSVARLLAPKVVAVIGASRTPGTVGNAVLVNICENGFAGIVHPVNPTRREHPWAEVLPVDRRRARPRRSRHHLRSRRRGRRRARRSVARPACTEPSSCRPGSRRSVPTGPAPKPRSSGSRGGTACA